MPTIHTVDGFAVEVYTRDHRPPHVHVFHRGGDAIIAIGSPGEEPTVREVYRMRMRDVLRALDMVRENQNGIPGCMEEVPWRLKHGWTRHSPGRSRKPGVRGSAP